MTPRVHVWPWLGFCLLHHALLTSAMSVGQQRRLPNCWLLRAARAEPGGLPAVAALAGSGVGALANGTVPGTW